MSRFSLLALGCAAILLLGGAPASALDLGGHDRDGMVIGLDLGYGWNAINLTRDDADVGTDVHALNGAFKIGWAPSDKFVGFVGISGWKRAWNQNLVPTTTSNFNFLVEVCWYPAGRGFWVKGGVGAGSTDLFVNTPLLQDRIDIKEGGLATTLGAGYEFRASGSFAVGISYDWTRIDMGDFGGIVEAETVNQVLAVAFRWYQD